jgi:hypothetical protein
MTAVMAKSVGDRAIQFFLLPWIASRHRPAPCADRWLAMMEIHLILGVVRSINCLISVVIRPDGETSWSMIEK